MVGGDARHSPIKSVILTGAEVDQVLGLLLLREFHSFDIYATTSVRNADPHPASTPIYGQVAMLAFAIVLLRLLPQGISGFWRRGV